MKHLLTEKPPKPPYDHQRGAERRTVVLPARLTWKDQRGAMRFATVMTRNVSELGVYGPGGDPRAVPPVTRTAGEPLTSWLLHADDDALAITSQASAPALWRRITQTGRPWQICAVGHEALLRYAGRCGR